MSPLSRVVEAVPFALPLRAPFRGLTRREGVVVRGPAGWGEFAPFAGYDVERDARWLVSALAAACEPARAALRDEVEVNAILPDVPGAQVEPFVVEAAVGQGCRTVKCKVGQRDRDADVGLVATVRLVLDRELGPGAGRIRVDANGRWSVEQAAAALSRLREYGIEYTEQPCASVAELRRLRRLGVGVPVAVDESIRVDRAWDDVADCADVAVLKVSPLGGPAVVADLAARLGVPVVLSGALESSIGLAQDVAVAAALPELPYACGFGTGALLADDLVAEPLVPREGAVPVSRRDPDPDALARARARLEPQQQRAWLARLDTAWRYAVPAGLVPQGHLTALGAG